MRTSKFVVLVLALLFFMPALQKRAEAHSRFSLNFGFGHRAYPYHYSPYFYSPYYYRPYYGYGYGYGYYGRPYNYGYRYGYYGEIRAEVKPHDAKVYVDGDYVGVADDFDGWWQRLKLEPGRHRVVFRAPGYAPYAITIRVLPGGDYHVKYQLQPGDDLIPDQDMRLNKEDDRYDRDREYDRKRSYEPDRQYESERDDDSRYGKPEEDWDRSERYEYQPNPSERDDDSRYGKPDEDWDRNERYEDQPNLSEADRQERRTLTFQIQPTDATIYVDGEYYGTADLNKSGEVQVMLPHGAHNIEVVRPGYESFSSEIQVDSNSENPITISLRKK